MFKQLTISVEILILLVMSVGVSHAFEVNVEFTAEAMQSMPAQPPVYSRMYVSKNAVRTESYIDGSLVVDITFPYQGRRLRLFPETKKYIAASGLPVKLEPNKKAANSPCDGISGSVCKSMGEEILHGIKVEKWQIERKVKDKVFKVLQWHDPERNLSLREMSPDGSIAELRTLGKSHLYEREVEVWEYIESNATGVTDRSKQWYDPELKMVIQEQKQGGYFRGLRNIKTGKQNKELFELPVSYQKVAN